MLLLYQVAASGWLTPYLADALTLTASDQWPFVSGQYSFCKLTTDNLPQNTFQIV